eukprot:comp7587_c0_seq1/m.3235 comp7587_c0_seq1/g.3235  ORF comp7587_c0_seq1/g.3235 comp7587_c0_seq1/m.3235 type:complete len:161 (+) comp7587_c0_seq1:585-1067(+)
MSPIYFSMRASVQTPSKRHTCASAHKLACTYMNMHLSYTHLHAIRMQHSSVHAGDTHTYTRAHAHTRTLLVVLVVVILSGRPIRRIILPLPAVHSSTSKFGTVHGGGGVLVLVRGNLVCAREMLVVHVGVGDHVTLGPIVDVGVHLNLTPRTLRVLAYPH